MSKNKIIKFKNCNNNAKFFNEQFIKNTEDYLIFVNEDIITKYDDNIIKFMIQDMETQKYEVMCYPFSTELNWLYGKPNPILNVINNNIEHQYYNYIFTDFMIVKNGTIPLMNTKYKYAFMLDWLIILKNTKNIPHKLMFFDKNHKELVYYNKDIDRNINIELLNNEVDEILNNKNNVNEINEIDEILDYHMKK